MCKISLNEELNGIELSFETKPGADILTAIKAAGFRWHNYKKIWYAKQTAERLTLAHSLETGEAPVVVDDQTELKKKYMDIITAEIWPGSSKMQEYAKKTAAYIVALENGDITDIDKPRIETSFCFGFGMYGGDPTNDQERADNVAHYARTHEEYFINENLSGLNEMIDAIKDTEKYYFYKFLHYTGQKEGSKLKGVTYCRYFDKPEENPGRWSNMREVEPLTDQERAALMAGYEKVKGDFVKRLNTYLKKYGLSKLNVWTYLRD